MLENRWAKLVLLLVASAVAASLGAIFGPASGTGLGVDSWYKTIVKPSWNPPNWIFGPVWTTLYIMMAVAAWRVWTKTTIAAAIRHTAMWIYASQLLVNGSWSALFFGLQSPALALGCIVLMWALIVLTILRFKPIDALAAWLLVPYLAWVSFATFLNSTIWWLNR
jgi:translocator protein